MKRALVAALAHAARLFDRLQRACAYTAAGLSSVDDVRRGVVRTWDAFLLDPDDVAAGWRPWEQQIAEAFVAPRSRVLVIGAGSGRDLIPFAARGCQVTGVDPASAAIDVARRALAARGLEADLRIGFFEDLDWAAGFDAVWFSWFTYSYIPSRARRIEILRRAASLLAPGGRIVISALRDVPRERLWRMGETAARWARNDWVVARGDRLTFVPGTTALRYEHCFGGDELRSEAMAAGLTVIHSAEFDTVHVLAHDA